MREILEAIDYIFDDLQHVPQKYKERQELDFIALVNKHVSLEEVKNGVTLHFTRTNNSLANIVFAKKVMKEDIPGFKSSNPVYADVLLKDSKGNTL